MTRKVAPPKSTGGGGYAFEDKVGAYWLVHLLAGRSFADVELGSPQRVRFQCRASDWLLDDIVVDFPKREGKPVQFAASVKSNRQIVANKFPEDFVTDAWSLLLNPGATAFDALYDRLALITASFSLTSQEALNDLIKFAISNPRC